VYDYLSLQPLARAAVPTVPPGRVAWK